MLRRSSISIPRTMLHQHYQILSKSRTFSTIGDGEQVPPIAEKVVEKGVDKEKDPPPRVVKKEPRKSSAKEDPKGVNKKQQLDILQQFYDASEAALRHKPDFSEEEKIEHHRIGRNYNIEKFKRHNRDNKDYANKCWLIGEALKSMRPDLRANAIIVDPTPPPKDRPFPIFFTPPIKGFKLKDYMKKSDSPSEISI